MRTRELAVSFGSLGAANILGKLCWVVSLMLMMRALGPEDFGVLAAIWSLFGFIAPLTDLGLSQLLVREGARDPAIRPLLLSSAMVLRLSLGVGALACVVLLSVRQVGPFAHTGWLILVVAAIAPLLDGAFQTATAVAQVEKRLVLLSSCRVAGFALMPVLLLYSLAHHDGALASAGSYAVASLVALVGFFALRGPAIEVRQSLPRCSPRTLLKQALPFMFMSAAALAYGKLEVVAISIFDGTEASAFYHLAYQVVLLMFSLPEVFFTVILASLYRARADVSAIARRWEPICRVICAFCAVVLPFLVWHSSDIVVFLGGESFQGATPVLWALLPMVALLPASTAMYFLMVLDQPARRAWIDAGCVATTVPLVAMAAGFGGVVLAACTASFVYGIAVFIAWRMVASMGLRMDWLRPMGVSIAAVSPSFLCWTVAWPEWWLGAAAQMIMAVLLLLGTGFIRRAHVVALLD